MKYSLMLIALSACTNDDKTDDSGVTDDSGATDDSGGADDTSTSDDTSDSYTWVGTRELTIDVIFSKIYDEGPACDSWFDTRGRVAAESCPGCDFAFDIHADWLGDDLGDCEFHSFYQDLTLGFMPDYVEGIDAMMFGYNGTWEPMFYADYHDGQLDYHYDWYLYIYGYNYTYIYLYSWTASAEVTL